MKSLQTLKTPLFRHASASAFLLLSLLILSASAEVPSDPPGKYSTSWLGNTYMDAAGHKNVTEELADLCLSLNGKIFTAGYAEAGGSGLAVKGGAFLGRYRGFNSGFGAPVKAVATELDPTRLRALYFTRARALGRGPAFASHRSLSPERLAAIGAGHPRRHGGA